MDIKELIGRTSLLSSSLECRTITPLLMHGGDKEKRRDKEQPASSQLRIPSIKGVIRYWFRALETDLETMYKREVELFGGSSDNALKSRLILTFDKQVVSKKLEKVLPHRSKSFSTYSISPDTSFTLHIKAYKKNEEYFEELLTYVKLSLYLGGFGQRSRRGFGSIEFVDETFSTPETWLQNVQSLIQKVSALPVSLKSEQLIVNKKTTVIGHPQLQAVHIGKAHKVANDVLQNINQASHDVAKKFEGILGSHDPRYASPIIGSVKKIGKEFYPIVTEVKAKNENPRYNDAKMVFLEKVGVQL
ncbi:type III-B CRISPR module RAMP protein Cmr1 [Pueribacillus theae]|uniref:Type III-B CRISPR module RAMP protein Cmr1 n=1 Tax=Pueribacillus theae TaxID=2171751 RepID=A0A2U1K7F5_9BACI|nr:type III-B CRISPR module RAMP protein Cmr1 [Pueribacillus theae]PWA13089.1 type III-B CRISPR module RAMP protein Cmr1 [Pueribacillus theae]